MTEAESTDRRGRPRVAGRPICVAAIGGVLLSGGCSDPTEPPVPPDVVLVVADTLRADYLSAYGHDRLTSPVIDDWALSGTLFERAWSGSSWTAPSMAMLFTGVVRSDNSSRLDPRQPTLVSAFHDAGYFTVGISSNALLTAKRGFDANFDVYQRYEIEARGRRSERNGWTAFEVVERALAAIDEAPEGTPVFAFLMPFDPHQPYLPLDGLRFAARQNAGRKDAFRRAMPPEARERLTTERYRTMESALALYEGEVAQVDEALGYLFDGLRDRGRAENLICAFTADHGEGLWQRAAPPDSVAKEKGAIPELYLSHGAMLEPEQIHVPLIFSGPGVPAGIRRPEAVWTLDLAPTLLSLAGLDPLPGDGIDLFGPAAGSDRPEIVSFISRGGSILVDGRFQLIVPTPHRAATLGLEPVLYDLDRDPRALYPIDDPELAAELGARLQVWWDGRKTEGGDVFDASERAALEALGYTDGEAEQGE